MINLLVCLKNNVDIWVGHEVSQFDHQKYPSVQTAVCFSVGDTLNTTTEMKTLNSRLSPQNSR